VFRYFEGGQQEDTQTFAAFDGGKPNSATAFATCYDQNTQHPVLFIAGADGGLHYFEVVGGKWKPTEIKLPDGGVRGAIACVYDEGDRGKKPCAFYRAQNGGLYSVLWTGSAFAVSRVDNAGEPGGAISAVWDPQQSGRPGGGGHPAVSYVAGNGYVHHMQMRDGKWKRLEIKNTEPRTHADPQMIASVVDVDKRAIGVFWGLIRYKIEDVPGSDPKLRTLVQQPAHLTYTTLGAEQVSTPVLEGVAGGIGAAKGKNVAAFGRFLAESENRFTVERVEGAWARRDFPTNPATLIAAAQGAGGAVIVGSRRNDRECDLVRYPGPSA
jgi:hypothetical protein